VTLLAPWYLLAGLAAAAIAVALHLIAFDRPRLLLLPTARFAPPRPERARTRARRPRDVALLALRIAALLLMALGLARPVRTATRAPLARVVVADVTASVARGGEVADSARALARPGDVVIAVGEAARSIPLDSLATLDVLPTGTAARAGAITSGIVRAIAAVREVARGADSAELVIVSPLAREEVDAATASAVAAWGGRVRVVPVATASAPAADTSRRIAVVSHADDAIAAAAARVGPRARAETRIVRTPRATTGDSAWAAAERGRVLVVWPPSRERDVVAARVRGIAWDGDALVAPLSTLDTASSRAVGDTTPARVVARWEDGTPAAVERPLGGGCIREVHVGVSQRGDVSLRTGMLRFVRALADPCGGRRDLATVAPAALGMRHDVQARPLPRAAREDAWRIGRWLLAAAMLLLLLEPLVRRGTRAGAGAVAAPARAAA
jgi:hypothetical protein